ncbi:MAG: BAX inhibitor (BI)-1/YccA family protein [Methylococcales bacterium]|jgi:modulator of FtsH protease|nr:BAX inhibitor (BI)-1/YccA family protein [Methylococcales bacterium]MBT7442878.1 BAX inhibitor (BI)-1/YccA family protein [Methylococcales bacterium]
MAEGNVFARSESSVLETNTLIRNTYTLLSMTLLFSGAMAGLAISNPGLGNFGFIGFLLGFIGLYFLVYMTRNSAFGIVSVFMLTGFLGLSLGPMLLNTLAMQGGGQIVMLAMAMTGTIFLGLSAYVLTTKKDFSFLSGFMMAGIILAVVGGLVAIIFQVEILSLAISGLVALLMCGMILWETSDLVNGHETNYIMATVGLYMAIFNLFVSLIRLLTAFND